MIQKFTENDNKPELMGKVVIINPVRLRRKKKKKKKRPPISYFTNIYNRIITKHDTSLPHPRKGSWVYFVLFFFYSSDMLLNNPHRVDTLTTL